jgi:hypothetical protein
MVATLGVGLERHGGHPGSGLGAAFYLTQPATEHPIHAPTPTIHPISIVLMQLQGGQNQSSGAIYVP